jgi:hypothetical protein
LIAVVQIYVKKYFMDKKQTKFDEQQAPLKNTDKAFVQVSKNGSPCIPTVAKEEDRSIRKKPTDLDKR